MLSQIPANLRANRSKSLPVPTFIWDCTKWLYQPWKVERKQVLRKRAALTDPPVVKLKPPSADFEDSQGAQVS